MITGYLVLLLSVAFVVFVVFLECKFLDCKSDAHADQEQDDEDEDIATDVVL